MIEQVVRVNNDPSFYSDIRGDLISHPLSRGFSLHHVDSVKSMHDNLNTLAMIVRFNSRYCPTPNWNFNLKATFIAAVQAQVITYAIQDDSTHLQVAVNTLFFASLFLDILGGCTAYMVAVQLQHIYALLLRRMTSISRITSTLEQYTPPPPLGSPSISKHVPDLAALSLHIQFLEVILFHALSTSTSTSAWHKSLLKVQESRRSIDDIIRILDKRLHARAYIHLQEYQRTTDELDKWRGQVRIASSAIWMLRMVVCAGMVCLVAGGLCYVKGAQPRGVWIPSFLIVGGVFVLFVVLVVQSSRL